MGAPECEGCSGSRAGPFTLRRTLSRASGVVRSQPPGVDEDTHAGRELPKIEGRRPKDRSWEGGCLISPRLATQRDRFLTAKQGRLLHQRHSFSTPRCRGVGTLCVDRPAGYLPPRTVGQWTPATLQWRTVDKGGDPKTNQEGTTRTPGWHPEEKESDPTARRGTLKPGWSASTHSEGKGPEDPGASCKAPRGNCRLQLVQADFLFSLKVPGFSSTTKC